MAGMAQSRTAAASKSSPESRPVRLEIIGVEKKKGISKYYVYVIKVTCRDGSHYLIFRRYRQFDEMQKHLEQRFPVEAGDFNQKERILPNLPGKVYLSRSAVREVTDKRLPLLNSYLQHLFSLADNIRYDSIVKAFTRKSQQDKQSTYHGNQTGCHGHQGSKATPTSHPNKPLRPMFPMPSPVRKKSPGPPRPAPPTKSTLPAKPPPPSVARGPCAKALYQYTGQYSDELSFQAGAVIALVSQVDGNWLQGRLGGQTGLVPGSYVSIVEPLAKQDSQDSIEQSDEWDSEDDLADSASAPSATYITYHVGGVANSVEVASDLVQKPTLHRLRNVIQDRLGRRNFVLNYRDRTGDLIEIVDQSDLNLMTSEPGASPHKPGHAPWALYITEQGDHTPYNTHPYR